MKYRLVCSIALALAVSSCATRQVAEQERRQREDSVDQRMLPPQQGGGGNAGVASYTLAPTQRFRMPRALHSEAPVLPADSPRQTLAPTTVCAHLILAAPPHDEAQRIE
ncbi:lipoprotein, putative [Xanthomonas oryzae pv. oryzicola BLS256]|uniref:Lipoprotein, putative n=1 Tax=Xanthomonas oryzae pv. oryzicola (strain BLS256) TaxID=383407 RepID=G7TEY5_XANOB|nr:lipoprotein, putative [Xanthomonas oryzae pv. oryzicola BLS256]